MIAVESLVKRYGDVLAVDGVTFTAAAGRVTGFLGQNGAGKSTTLRCLVGLTRADSGSATVDGSPFPELKDPARQCGVALDPSSHHPDRTGRHHLQALALAARLPRSRIDEVLDLVELTGAADRRAGGYSLGMRQRLHLAAALLGDPSALVLDEPANGLDPQGIRWLRDLLRHLAAEGRTVLLSSHQLPEVRQTVDDVVIVAAGRLVAAGTLAAVLGGEADVRVRTPRPAALTNLLRARGGTVTTTDGAGDIRGSGEPDAALLVSGLTRPAIARTALDAGLLLTELTTREQDLETRFFELTGGPA